MLFCLDRASCRFGKPLRCYGKNTHRHISVTIDALSYRLQHKQPLYTESEWWHHLPVIPELPGSETANATSIALPYFTKESPEMVEGYIKAFEKVWAHRSELA